MASSPSRSTRSPTAKKKRIPEDGSSRSNPNEVAVTHLQWELEVDFDESILRAEARYTIRRVDSMAPWLSLDTAKLHIESVTDQTGKELEWSLHAEEPGKGYLGSQLDIEIPDSVTQVAIKYETSPQSTALQWLHPSQTVGKEYPYVYSQCQAIHARSLLPCQDRPGVKFTYRAKTRVPSWAVCVMGAVQIHSFEDDHKFGKVSVWMQDVPVPSYLIAIAVGQLERKEISSRCALWSEPAIADIAANEFSETEDFLRTAESIAGISYVWGRYDLLCLPPSFPFGGMENPCLTFVTPTLLAGDKSLVGTIAHEIAHSWTGNLVTNATWDHFWLNEGWTKWFERKIMARIRNDERYIDLDAIGGYKMLRDTVNNKDMPPEWTKLVTNFGDVDPDSAYSIVAYEKGFNLLMALERRVGTDAFEKFFRDYLKNFANSTLTSYDFRDFCMSYFSRHNNNLRDFDWDSWFHDPGMPPDEPHFDRTWSMEAENLAEAWIAVDRNGEPAPSVSIQSWTSNQKVSFLDTLQILTGNQPLQIGTLNSLHKEYGFGESQNAEILFRYCQLALAAEDESILLVVLHFVTSQGRMKFTRTLYRAMFASKKFRNIAKAAFLENREFYHSTTAKLIASDLLQIEKRDGGISMLVDKAQVSCAKAYTALASMVAETGMSWEMSFAVAALVTGVIGLIMTQRTQ
ncbi:hypothetical protein ACA910_002844 [Epithemia clementina (nom. ined.)]